MKRRLAVILFVLFFFCVPLSVYADASDYVIDREGFLSEEEIQELNSEIQEIADQYDTGVYIRFYDDYDTADIESYAEKIYQEENLGIGDDQNGIMLIVTMADRSYDIAAHGELANQAFTDYGKQEMADDFLSYLSEGEYYEASEVFISDVSTYLYEAVNNDQPVDTWIPYTSSTYEEEYGMSDGTKLAITIAVPCLLSLIICLLIARRNKTSAIAARADAYIPEGGMRITGRQDIFLYQTRSVTHINREPPNNGSGGSFGGTSVNSSGFSHSSGHF